MISVDRKEFLQNLDLNLLVGWFGAMGSCSVVQCSHAATFVRDGLVAKSIPRFPENRRFEVSIVFSAYQLVEKWQLTVFFFLHHELDVREDRAQIHCGILNLVSTDDDKCVITILYPQSWSVGVDSQHLQLLHTA
ncbi:unnamed protein product [Schistocephalus solidus]|uniref:Uncharacterized protein n=1 Tax=Schistocephalus solidus TaxID=70667 RepID=A0A183SCF5_SCHSO|nr:unnamed protein product [Schistocephalus solidus]